MKVVILGAGYSGLNAYYNLVKKRKDIELKIISEDNYFKYYTLFFRYKLYGREIPRIKIPFIFTEKVIDIDPSAPMVVTDKGKYEPDILIVATGCYRDLDKLLSEIKSNEKIRVGAWEKYDEYLALQLTFYLKKVGRKEVEYCGSYLEWLGKEVSDKIESILSEEGIKTCEKPTVYFPECKPTIPLGFLKVNEYLKVSNVCFGIGDVVNGMPKVGELAMREGIYVARLILGAEKEPFKPIFINILETPSGKGLHIRSNKPWGGNYVSVKYSRFRSVMKRFIEFYYVTRKGNMGILSRL